MSATHSRSTSQERIPAEVERDMLGLRAQILDNMKTWYALKHPSKKFDFSIVTASYQPTQGRNLYSACIVATTTSETGVQEIHSKHDVRRSDYASREDTSKTRIEALETLLADLEWRMDLCMHQYETRLKRAPRVSNTQLIAIILVFSRLSMLTIVSGGSQTLVIDIRTWIRLLYGSHEMAAFISRHCVLRGD